MSKPQLVNDWFDFSNAVEVSDRTKEQYIEDAIAFLESNPDEHMTYVASGDTLILVHRDDDGTYEVKDLKVRKEGSFIIGNSAKPSHCICDTKLLVAQGCQCGGN